MDTLRRTLCVLLAAGFFLAPLGRAAAPRATWTTGLKKVLIIPVRFSDCAGPSDTPSANGTSSGWGNIANGTATAAMSTFMAAQSYGLCTLQFTVLPEIDMGVPISTYNAPLNADSALSKFTRYGEPGSFLDDVRARARQVGEATGTPALYDTENYDLDIIATGFIPGQSENATAVTFGKGIYANLFTALSHELSHNLGLSHAWGASRASFAAPLSPRGTFFEFKYGNPFDLMGYKETHQLPLPADRDAGAFWKHALGWLPDAQIATGATSGTYRIYPIDAGAAEAGRPYALRIVRDPTHTYWLEHRQGLTGPDALWASNGLLVQFGAESFLSSSGDTYLLDMTPGSRGYVANPQSAVLCTMRDAPLALGRTYSDLEANLHITPIRKGGTVPESIDVVVNHGPFPNNHAPPLTLSPAVVGALAAGTPQTFTASAADPDGEPLVYYWEFDDPDAPAGVTTGGSNADTRLASQGTHTWTRAGTYLVRCTVSDLKGGRSSASAQVTVTGGSAALLTISGVVRDENGLPLAGATVNNYNGLVTSPQTKPLVSYGASNFVASNETAADGKYRVQIPATHVSGTIYRLSVLGQGYTFACSVTAGAIALYGASIANVDFARVRASRTISGSIAVAGRSYDPVSDGPLSVDTGTGGVVQAGSGFWTATLPDNTLINLSASAANPAYAVTSSFSNPHRVVNDYAGFYFAVTIPGKMPETGFGRAGASGNDTVGTVQIPVAMTLPPGLTSWVQPQGFFYWIDPSSTAEYGVDYKMAGGEVYFYGGKAPSPRLIALHILPTGKPKKKTVVIKLGVASNIANLGPISTFTYTIENPFQLVIHESAGNPAPPQLTLQWDSVPAVEYTIEATSSLSAPEWTAVAPHLNLPGELGTMSRSVPLGNAPAMFYRIKADW